MLLLAAHLLAPLAASRAAPWCSAKPPEKALAANVSRSAATQDPPLVSPVRSLGCCGLHAVHEPRAIWRELLSHLGITPADGLFVDVGTSYDMADGAKALNLSFAVVAFEARPDAAAKVRGKNEKELRSGRLRLLNLAVSDRPGTLQMRLAGDSSSVRASAVMSGLEQKIFAGGGARTIDVEAARLDSLFCSEPIAVLKLDIQGNEYEALLGAEGLLRRRPSTGRHRPGLSHHAPHGPRLVVFELYEALRPDLKCFETLHLMRLLGYTCYDLSNKLAPQSRLAGFARAETCPLHLNPGAEAQAARPRRPLSTDFACVRRGGNGGGR